MRLKNKNSIEFSIAKTKHAETPLVIGEKEKIKKMRLNFLSQSNRMIQSQSTLLR